MLVLDPQKTIRAALVKNIRLGQGPLVF
eukprot:COSAG06_NODE_15947_length_1033_cov_1.189507_3_plen_27_part_01